MDVNKLREKMDAAGMNVETLASEIGINRASMYRKLARFERITIGEALRIKDALDLSDEDASHIFLT